MPAIKAVTVKAASLVLDMQCYPRHLIDDDHIRDMAEALRAGIALPPIVIEKSTRRIVDGVHRWHAAIKVGGEEAAIEVLEMLYASEADLYEDAARRNAGHGRKLTKYDIARVHIRAQELGMDDERIARALNLTMPALGALVARKTATIGGVIVPIKATSQHLAGSNLTPTQLEGNRKTTGLRPLAYVNQVINLIEHDLIDRSDIRLIARLTDLSSLVTRLLSELADEPADIASVG